MARQFIVSTVSSRSRQRIRIYHDETDAVVIRAFYIHGNMDRVAFSKAGRCDNARLAAAIVCLRRVWSKLRIMLFFLFSRKIADFT
ncbi:hypothetical protein HPB48_010505 [Haemaphysalis longicornis]|uniref:Uncharacterized protein n=1 Tax=Haemaphysalis longicornis TaxID=44386 RepID=A0A9J6FLW4_HAELO|nr:hypothetical protein HPB48_010505 [Haemaphysalis longicornis]